MKALFDEYDTDGSGEISRDELYEIVERVIGSHTSAMHIVNVRTISNLQYWATVISFVAFIYGNWS